MIINGKQTKIIVGIIVLAAIVIGIFFGTNRAPKDVNITIPAGLTRIELARAIGTELKWNDKKIGQFAATLAEMQWLAFSKYMPEIFDERYKWGEEESEALLTNSSLYIEPKYDVLGKVYLPEVYTFSGRDSVAQISQAIIAPVLATSTKEFISEHLDSQAADNVAGLIRSETENLPDLVPTPPADLVIEITPEDKILLRFSTTYYNQGEGPLELYADPSTRGIRSDITRDVFQRIYKKNGGERSRISGTFMWHQEHLHYHFSDFAVYDLEAIETEGPEPDLSGSRQKSTFCIRDVSKTDLVLKNYVEEAGYRICGKEKQGISVGWGDTYYYTYPDQLMNITDLPTGTYKLTFVINPLSRFDELDMSNNTSSVTIRFDKDKRTIEELAVDPEVFPNVEHVYPDECGVTIVCS